MVNKRLCKKEFFPPNFKTFMPYIEHYLKFTKRYDGFRLIKFILDFIK